MSTVMADDLPHRQTCRTCGRAWWCATIGAAACAVLALATFATIAWALLQRRGDQGVGFAVAELLGFILLAAIPTGMVCLTGIGLSIYALGKCASRDAKRSLLLSAGVPLGLVVLFVVLELVAAILAWAFAG